MIPLFKPSYDDQEYAALKDVLSSGWIGLGPKTAEFEERFKEYIGAKVAVGLNSGTAALHLALKAFDIEDGEVITSPLTFVSTAHVIKYCNADVVFCDVEEDTLCASVDDIAKKITKRTRAILPIHYGGHTCDMDRLRKLADDNNLILIDDCAHACGGQYKGKRLGTLADASCFSFHAVKNLATGEGGMITTDHEEIADRLKQLRWLGIDKGTWNRAGGSYLWNYSVNEVGYKYHLSDIPSTLGLIQLTKLERLNERRRQISSLYDERLKKIGWIKLLKTKDYALHARHNYAILIDRDRDRFMNFLAEKGVSTGVHYLPLYRHPVYKDAKIDCPVVEKVADKIVVLPLFPDLTQVEIEQVIGAIEEFDRLS